MGLRYVAGLRQEAGERIGAARAAAPFTSIADVAVRAALRDDELQTLAHVGAFASFGLTRREALWQASAVPQRGTLFARTGKTLSVVRSPFSVARTRSESVSSTDNGKRRTDNVPLCPLPEMSPEERTLADYKGTGITVGPHLMQYLRAELDGQGVVCACDLPKQRNGSWMKVAGLVIVRQRPGTAKGFCFLTLEDETGIGNAVVTPDVFQRHRAVIHTAALLIVEGPLQVVDDVAHVRARRFTPLALPRQSITQTGSGYRLRLTPEDETPALPKSHDFR